MKLLTRKQIEYLWKYMEGVLFVHSVIVLQNVFYTLITVRLGVFL